MSPIASKQHIDRISAALSSGSAAARSRLSASWKRSWSKHGLDPARDGIRCRLTAAQMRARREALGQVLALAAPRLEGLYGMLGGSGCAVLLTDAEGVVLERRCETGDAADFDGAGLIPGADWSEAAQGTNGIGTCLVEKRGLTILRDQHYLARNIGMSCMDAPIFGPDGALIAALDVSAVQADQSPSFLRLAAAMTARTAAQIEADAFRAAFPQARILVAPGAGAEEEGAALLAVDRDDIVIGATRAARRAAGLSAEGPVRAMPAADLLGAPDAAAGLEDAERAALIRALARAEGNVSAAARGLGIGRATLYRRMKRLGVGDYHA